MIEVAAIAIDADATAAVKAYLRIAGSDEDETVDALIAAAIGHGEAFTGQQFLLRGVTETIPATGDWQRLSRTPVTAVGAVQNLDPLGATVPLPVDSYAIDIDAAGDGWVRIMGSSPPARCSVQYSAGLASSWALLPEAVRQGTVRLASHLYTHRDDADDGPPPAAVVALWRPWRRMHLL